MRWLRLLLFVAAGTALFFGGELWASSLQPHSVLVLPRSPLLPAPSRPHLRAPRVVVPASPSVAAHFRLNGSGGGPATVQPTAGGESSTAPTQAAGASPVHTGQDIPVGQSASGRSHPSHGQKPPTHGPKPPHHGPPPRPPHHPPPPPPPHKPPPPPPPPPPHKPPPPPPPPPPHKPPPPEPPTSTRPGHGYGDKNHEHTGPPGGKGRG
jgi:hypothetical protein